MKKPIIEMITIDDVLKLLKKEVNLDVTRGSIYNYIKNDGFPENTGRGIPRSWRKHEVLDWCARYGKGQIK